MSNAATLIAPAKQVPTVARHAAPLSTAAPPTTRYQPLVLLLVPLCVGIFLDRHADWKLLSSSPRWWLLAVASLAMWFALWRRGNNHTAMLALAVSLAATAAAWHHWQWNLFSKKEIGRYAQELGQPAAMEVVALSAPRYIPAPPLDPLRTIPVGPQSRLEVRITAIRSGAAWQPSDGRTPVIVDGHLTGVRAGDTLQLFGQLAAPAPAANPGEFDFALHARADRQLSIVRVEFPECVSIVRGGSAWNPTRWLDDIRHRGDALLWHFLNRDRAGLAAAIFLGEREQIDRETTDAYMQTGTIHVLSISGLHVGILAWLLFKGFRTGLVSRRAALVAVMAVTGAYALLTNAEPPVIRATLLVWIICGALWLGREGLGMNSLAAAALVVLALNPADLFRTGVQLSFLSVAVLIWIAPKLMHRQPPDALQTLIRQTRPPLQRAIRWASENVVKLFIVGAIIWVIITPLTMSRFHLLSPAALVLNVLLIPVVTLAMISGFGVLLFGWLLPPLGWAFAWVCDGSLTVLDKTVKTAADLPGSNLWVAGPDDRWLALFYVAVAAMLLVPRFVPPPRWRVAMVSSWCALAVIGSLPPRVETGDLRCTFVSVGHGCGVVLELPNGRTMLYDAGRLGSPAAASRGIAGYLWSRGITHLDAVIISHADADHYNALPEVLRKFSAGAVYVSPVMFAEKTAALRVLKDSIVASGASLELMFAGDKLRAGSGVNIEVLHPPPEGVGGSDNANSIVLAIEYDGRRILLTGDLEPPGLQAVTNEEPWDCDVLLAPHHGSAGSDPPQFAAWCRPEFVIFSSGQTSDTDAAKSSYEEAGAKIFHTAKIGAVTATIAAGEIEMTSYRVSALP